MLQPVIESMGYEFVGAQFGQAENGLTLRIFIDKQDGIVLDDCAAVSRQVSAALDVEDTIESAYLLEVSSPGIDRPLFTAEQFGQQVGQAIKVKMNVMVLGRRNFTGELLAVEDQLLVIDVDGQDYELPVADIESARLEVNF